ncbi:pyridoxal phosphate-dependent aminotransferase [Helicobacter sp. MIT 14-3879]|uniref:pyridoxal phosphate-dependent aminotransferase n=1 Tax=Helicobacter sp. MIT 14-3879 TaxID=2040649 RepID=UPI000E1E3802|nr:pyridoxal phosphate-dependent aminotransferase [Helicobacter sp. MIT 14-3879]RDU63977.1 pyridoxal phosphate-dependent aminotransferase [Helicobacter sp. MIT 14-3879]
MKYSSRITKLGESLTIAISSLARDLKEQGRDILSFSAGEPDFDTPKSIKDEAIRAINSGFTKYTQVSGINELKLVISDKLKKENLLNYEPSEIIVSNGAKHSLFNAFSALIDKNDEVIIPSPYWVTYPELVNYFGGKSIFIQTSEDSDFKITSFQLKQAITSKTKLLILTSPSNPTGMIYSKDELEAIYDVIKDTGIIIISDEIYEKLVYDNIKFVSCGSINDDMLNRTITINGLSKSSAMTGWRMGYLASKDKQLIKLLNNLQSQSTSNINSITQKASIIGLNGDSNIDTKDFCQTFENRRNLAYKMINQIQQLKVKLPQGAFYLFINIQKVNNDSIAFCKDLLEKEGVALVPGIAFGMEGYVRFSFACSEEHIIEGIKRIDKYIKSIIN